MWQGGFCVNRVLKEYIKKFCQTKTSVIRARLVINITMKTLNNKYSKWYWKLIESRRHQDKGPGTECHHIVPRSLGGTDTELNLIHLSGREHFIAHLLLSRMFTGKNRSKMRFAARQMLSSYTPNSRIYAIVKRDANLAMKALWRDPEWKFKVTEERKARLSCPAERILMSKRMVEVWEREDYIRNHRKSMELVWSDEDWILKNSIAQAESWKDPVKRDNRLKNRKPHTDETKIIQSVSSTESNKRSWADPAVREKRIAGIKAAVAKKKAAKAASLIQ